MQLRPGYYQSSAPRLSDGVKAWIDQILRAGRTFMSTPAGKVGMLSDRPVFIGIASGGVFTGDRANQPDFLTSYLSVVLGSVGLKSLQFLPLQATAFLDWDQATLAREKVLAAIDLTVMATVPRPATAKGAYRSTGILSSHRSISRRRNSTSILRLRLVHGPAEHQHRATAKNLIVLGSVWQTI